MLAFEGSFGNQELCEAELASRSRAGFTETSTGVRVKASLCWMLTICEKFEVLGSYCFRCQRGHGIGWSHNERAFDISPRAPPETSLELLSQCRVPVGAVVLFVPIFFADVFLVGVFFAVVFSADAF